MNRGEEGFAAAGLSLLVAAGFIGQLQCQQLTDATAPRWWACPGCW